MARRKLIAGNWKMNNNIPESVILAQEISNILDNEDLQIVDVAICPPFVDLKSVSGVFEFDRRHVNVGAQDVYWEPSGAYTGEISVGMIASAGCSLCIVGHSERRQLFGETNEDVNRKAKALLEYAGRDMTPIICVGESLAVREEGNYIEYIDAQVRAALAGIEDSFAAKCVIAYEPIWAIGTGRTATPEQAQEVCSAIRKCVESLYGNDVSEKVRILYGGSMNEGNAEELLGQQDIDGGLIGGASLKASSFAQIAKAAL